jgi:hypothetical protein
VRPRRPRDRSQTNRALRSSLDRRARQGYTDSITHDSATESDKLGLTNLLDKLTTAEINTSTYGTELILTSEGQDGNGTLSLGAVDYIFTGNRKPILSLTSPLSLLYAISLKKITAHLTPESISPVFLRFYRIPKSSSEESEIITKTPIVPHTTATINRADLAAQAVEDATSASNGRHSPRSRVTRLHHVNATTEQHTIVFTTSSLDSHGASMLPVGGC